MNFKLRKYMKVCWRLMAQRKLQTRKILFFLPRFGNFAEIFFGFRPSMYQLFAELKLHQNPV